MREIIIVVAFSFSLFFTSFVDGATYNTFTVGSGASGIGFDSLGNIWTANTFVNTVTKLSSNGASLGTFTVGNLPQCLAIDNQNRVWITNYNDGTVAVLANNGASITGSPITVGSYPYGITTDKSGNIWVANSGSNNVMKLNSSDVGTTIGTFNTGNTPKCIAFDSNNHAWITNNGDGTLTNLDNSGNFIGTFTLGSGGASPIGIAVDSNNDIWAVNDGAVGSNAISVYKFSNDGTQIGSYPAGNNPTGIAIDSHNNAWITNYNANTVTKLSNSGTQLALYSVATNPKFLAFDSSGNAWVTCYDTHLVTEIEPALASSTSAPTSTHITYNTFNVGVHPYGIDVDSLGNVWNANYGDNSVTKLSSGGTTLGTYTVGNSPYCLTIDDQNRVWVANFGDGTVSVLENNGTSATTITVGTWPFGIATDKSGNIWVVNSNSNNVMKLSSSSLGTILGTFNTGHYPQCIAFDSNNHAWITNNGAGTLTNLDNSGNFIGTFTLGSGGTSPVGIAVDSNNDIWAIDSNGAAHVNSVYKFSNAGAQIGSYPAGNVPFGIAIDINNNAWITNDFDKTVTVLSNSGSQLALYNVGNNAKFIAFDLVGNAWVANYQDFTVTEIVIPTPSPTTSSPTTPTPSPTTHSPTTQSPTTLAPTNTPTTKSPTISPTTPQPTIPTETISPSTQSPTVQEGASTLSPTGFYTLVIVVPILGSFSIVVLLFWARRRNNNNSNSKEEEKIMSTTREGMPFAVIVDSNRDQAISVNGLSASNYASSKNNSRIESGASVIQVAKLLRIKPQQYVLKEKIGAGGFSQVFKVEYAVKGKGIEIYAFKQFIGLELGSHEAEKISEEIQMLSLLEHPNIVKLIGVSDDPNSVDENGKQFGVGIVMEYCENGSWRKILDKDPFPRMDLVIHILIGVANGMANLHQHEPHPIIHRDLKGDNILLDKNMNAKICDFGLSKISETIESKGKTSASGAGTMQYKAPETFEGDFGKYSDVYAFGCVIFESLSGKRPWDGLSDMQIVKKISIGAPLDISICRTDASPALIDLMKHCLDYPKINRPSFIEIKTEIEKLNPRFREEVSVDVPVQIEKKYLAFVSHHKVGIAAALAGILKNSLEELQTDSHLDVFVDQEEGHLDLSQLLVHLEESKTVILLLTKEVLHRPYCLLELNHAIVHGIPIVAVLLEGEGYDLGGAQEYLTHLDTNLNKTALSLIKQYEVDVLDIAYHLSNIIPNIIAKRYNFKDAESVRNAEIGEIMKAVQIAKFSKIAKSKKDWLSKRPKNRNLFGKGG